MYLCEEENFIFHFLYYRIFYTLALTLNPLTMATFRIKENLFLVNKKVISYSTHVATIENEKLIELGKFSRTTSRHIELVAKLLNLELVPCLTKRKQDFDKYHVGIKCHIKDAIKFKILKTINKLQNEGYDYLHILAIIKFDCSEKEWALLSKGFKIDSEVVIGSQLLKKFDLI